MKALVTGGGGFLGKVIVRMLLERGTGVRTISRSAQPELEAMGVEHVTGDIGDEAAIIKAADGCDIVYHVAAKAGIWGPYDEYYKANVLGTKNVINACHAKGIRKLVYTSSPSIVFDGSDMEGVDESVPYPEHFEAYYPETKAEAERLVLAANNDKLAT
ncbi:MAG: NAD-dependent epimerase/dehydratase family protein, partial [Proteobacteria bacterium]|nr:NAD-dependent epimerase/dehydratase family protein [Pseudomonadota bacterium]